MTRPGPGTRALAILAAALAAKLDLPVAVRLANLAAGISVGKVGASVVREADLLAALTPQRSALRKIVSREQAVEQAERWRHRGWRVGFTNGYFDLLQPGHIHLLEQARAACDRLIVGVNSDSSVRRMKGAAASGAAGSRPRRRAGQLRLRRPGLPVRRGHARSR